MADKCDRFFDDIDNEFLSREEKEKIFDRLKNIAEKGGTREDLDKYVEELKRTYKDLSKTRLTQDYRSAVKFADAMDFIKTYGNPVDGLNAFLVGDLKHKTLSGSSVDATNKAWRAEYIGKMEVSLKNRDVFKFWQQKHNEVDIANALFDESRAKSNQSIEVARGIKEVYGQMVDHLNSEGANIKERDDFISTQTHRPDEMEKPADTFRERQKIRSDLREKYKAKYKDKSKIANAVQEEIGQMAFRRWSNFILPRLDLEKTFKDDAENEELIEKIMRRTYRKIVHGAGLDDSGQIVTRNLGKTLGDQLASRRFFHFKDGQSWLEYNEKFGSGNIKSSVYDNVVRMANSIGTVQKMGLDPDGFFKKLSDSINATTDNVKVTKSLSKSEKRYNVVVGKDRAPGSALGAKISSALRAQVSMRDLGGVVLSSLPDVAQTAATLRANGFGFLDAYASALKAPLSFLDGPERKQLADSIGVMADSLYGHYRNKFVGVDSVPGAFSKAMGLYFKFVGQQLWDKVLREGTATALARHLAQNKDKAFDKLPRGLNATLDRYGISDREWDLLRSDPDALKNYGGKQFITPDVADYVDDATVKKYLRVPNATSADILEGRRKIRSRLRTYLVDQTDSAQIQHGAAEKFLAYRGTNPGTVPGEILRFIYQFKFYGLGIARRHINRLYQESLEDRPTAIRHFAEYMAGALGMGFISVAAKSFITTGSIPNPNNLESWEQAAVTGGGFGLYGDLLTHQYSKFGAASEFIGPAPDNLIKTAGLLQEIADVTGSNKTSYHNRALKAALNLTYKNLPNTIYTKYALDHFLYNEIMDQLDPGYTNRLQRKLRERTKNNIQIL